MLYELIAVYVLQIFSFGFSEKCVQKSRYNWSRLCGFDSSAILLFSGCFSFSIQVHDLEFSPSIDIIVQETLPMLQELREKGLIKNIGIAGYIV